MASNNGESILIIDDDALSRKMLVRSLSETGYECDESTDGEEACGKKSTASNRHCFCLTWKCRA